MRPFWVLIRRLLIWGAANPLFFFALVLILRDHSSSSLLFLVYCTLWYFAGWWIGSALSITHNQAELSRLLAKSPVEVPCPDFASIAVATLVKNDPFSKLFGEAKEIQFFSERGPMRDATPFAVASSAFRSFIFLPKGTTRAGLLSEFSVLHEIGHTTSGCDIETLKRYRTVFSTILGAATVAFFCGKVWITVAFAIVLIPPFLYILYGWHIIREIKADLFALYFLETRHCRTRILSILRELYDERILSASVGSTRNLRKEVRLLERRARLKYATMLLESERLPNLSLLVEQGLSPLGGSIKWVPIAGLTIVSAFVCQIERAHQFEGWIISISLLVILTSYAVRISKSQQEWRIMEWWTGKSRKWNPQSK